MSGTSRRREREREERRRAILEAAREVHREKGLAAATMDEVAQRAELSKGALYLYFESKEELFSALALRPLELLVERFDAIARSGARGLDRVEHAMRAHASSLIEHRDVFRLGVALRQERDARNDVDTSNVACAFRDHKAYVFRFYVEALEDARADGAMVSDADVRMLATQIWASLMGAAMLQVEADRRRLPDGVAPEAALAAMPDLLAAAIRARTSAPVESPVRAAQALRGRRE